MSADAEKNYGLAICAASMSNVIQDLSGPRNTILRISSRTPALYRDAASVPIKHVGRSRIYLTFPSLQFTPEKPAAHLAFFSFYPEPPPRPPPPRNALFQLSSRTRKTWLILPKQRYLRKHSTSFSCMLRALQSVFASAHTLYFVPQNAGVFLL